MVTFKAKMKDGTTATVYMEDCGDTVPAFDASGNRYEAWTSKFWSDKFPETYAQCDKKLAYHNMMEFRAAEDEAILESVGVDTSEPFEFFG